MSPHLTDLAIRKLATAPGKRIEIWDSKVPGFGMRVTPSGTRSFVLMYRVNGHQRRLTLGQYPILTLARAREKAITALQQVGDGIDPNPTKEDQQRHKESQAAYRFDEAVGSFVTLHCERHNRPVTARDTARILNSYFIAPWADRDIREITRIEIVRLLDAIAEDGKPSAANHALSAIRKFFNWCVERGMLDVSPCHGVKKPTKDRSRDRVLDDAEIKTIWQAADKAGYPFGPIIKLLLLTAQRRNEVGRMQWHHLDLTQGLWTLPAELTKSNRQHMVPLSPETRRLLASLPRQSKDYVFATRNTGGPFVDFSGGKRLFDQVANVQGWTLHDLRRTAATQMAKLGTPPHVVERILNHTSGTFGGVAGVYNRFQYVPEMREALERWAAQIRHLTSADTVPARLAQSGYDVRSV